jgi:hypothetical protein
VPKGMGQGTLEWDVDEMLGNMTGFDYDLK